MNSLLQQSGNCFWACIDNLGVVLQANAALESHIAVGQSICALFPDKEACLQAIEHARHQAGTSVSLYGNSGETWEIFFDTHTIQLFCARPSQELHLLHEKQELEKMLYMISHDMRGAINSAIGLIDIMKEQDSVKAVKQLLGMQEQSMKRIDKFVLDVLSHSRNQRWQLEPSPIDWQTIISDAIAMHAHQYPQVRYASEINGQSDAFRSDPLRLRMVVSNLISNAFKFHNAQLADPCFKIEVLVANDVAVFEITDNGIGIPPQHQDKVFDMFYRATSRIAGNGLGLYIVREATHKLGGQLSFSSIQDVGSSFKITIPSL